jgi:arylsulfatase A-like enzyme
MLRDHASKRILVDTQRRSLQIQVMRVLILALFLPLSLASAVQPAAKKPNILFIAVDDLNDWIGPLGGHPQASTPHLDRLAAMGTTFTNAHCQGVLCNPSRTSLLTGLRPTTTGIYGLQPWFRQVPDLKDLKTLPQYFREKGYRTLVTGKVFHGNYGFKAGGAEWDAVGPEVTAGPFPKKKLVNTPSSNRLVDWGTFPHKDEDKDDYKFAGWAAERLADMPDDKPFFLATGFFLPHVPCYATQKWMELYPEETLKLPEILENDRADTPRASWWLHWKLPEPRLEFLKKENQWKNLVRSYLATISFMDAQLGRVLDALEKSGHAGNTVIVLWSDHGWHLGEKEITGKNTLWERSTRVPLIFAGPGSQRGARCTEPVELLDIFPTLCDLAGLPHPEHLEGHSLVPQLKDATASRKWPAISNHNPGNNSVRDTRWRYIRYVDGSEELYDLQKDPHEFHNLAGDPAFAVEIARLGKWIPSDQAPHVPGSAARILEFRNGVPIWEGKPIHPDDPIPEISSGKSSEK